MAYDPEGKPRGPSPKEGYIDPRIRWALGYERENVTAKDLLHDCINVGRVFQGSRLPTAARNERWFHGDQFDDADEPLNESDGLGKWDGRVPKHARNLLRNYSLTRVARVLEERQRARVWPNSIGGGDPIVADISNLILEYLDSNSDQTHLYQRALTLAEGHSCCAIKTTVDPDRGPVMVTEEYIDPETGDVIQAVSEPMGEVVSEVCSIFAYWTDGAERIEDSKWCVFSSSVDKDDALGLLMDAGYPSIEARQKISEAKGKGGAQPGYSSDGTPFDYQDNEVPTFEVWWRPCRAIPAGLLLSFVGDCLVMHEDYPYQHEQLPLSVIKIGERRGSPYGSTHFDDAVPVQRQYNEAISILLRQAWETRNTYCFTTNAIKEQMTGDNLVFGVPDPEKTYMTFVQPPGPNEKIAALEESAKEQMYQTYGVSEFVEGEGVTGTTAGKTVAYVNKLSSMKLKETMESINSAQKREAKQRLCLVQQYYGEDRVVSIVGEHRRADVQHWLQADLLNGVDIRLETAQGDSALRAATADEASQAIIEGRIDPATGAEIVETGLNTTAGESVESDIMRGLIEDLLNTGEIQPDDRVTPGVAIREIAKALSVIGDHEYADALYDLLAYYRSLGAQAPPGAGVQPLQETEGPGGIPVDQV